MRLSTKEIETIKKSVKNISSEAEVYLFGSRVDDEKRGGDIDILIVSNRITKKDLRKVRVNFYKEFGEQKMDIVVDDGTFLSPFKKIISKKAIRL